MEEKKGRNNQILEMIKTLIEASEELYRYYQLNEFSTFHLIYSHMMESANCIYENILVLKEDDESIYKLNVIIKSVMDTLERISRLCEFKSTKVFDKIEYELIPLLKDLYIKLYYWNCIYLDKEKTENYYKREVLKLGANHYIDQADLTGKYKYDLSIIIIGYNKLEYTKLCVESLLRFIPQNLNYELILLNHGSTDNTKVFFESVSPTKQIDIFVNGVGTSSVTRIVEGKYSLIVSNDVLITEGAISNMLKCISSDDRIAWVVPTTPNVSNLQTIDTTYKNMDEMYEFAKNNNVSNPFRWEQRVRLCNPVTMVNNKLCYSSAGVGYTYYMFLGNYFPDDKACLVLRRNGYKMILAKDAYCYHFGSVTLKEELSNFQNSDGNQGVDAYYLEGRKEFYRHFGIDPWGTGYCWDPQLFKYLPCYDTGKINVLGINCGIGSNPLKVKESIKENVHNLDVTVYNITNQKNYIQDLKGVSDFAEYVDSFKNIVDHYKNMEFNYIIFESGFEAHSLPLELVNQLNCLKADGGMIAIKISNKNPNIRAVILAEYANAIQSGEWLILI